MRRPTQGALMVLGVLGALLPTSAKSQDQRPPPLPPDTADLVFEREVFFYPQYERRNPFVRLLSGAEGGPRYEELRLIGVIFSPDPDRSVALFGPRSGQGEAAQQAARRTYRARRGETLGNVRILEIQQTRVVVEVEEFGLTEQHIMELQRPGQGGSL